MTLVGRGTSPFNADPVATGEHFVGRRTAAFEPERRLAIAILQDAIECYQKHLLLRDHTFEDAEAWIMSREHEYLFSFEGICQMLDVNAQCLRRGLVAWRERQLRQLDDERS